MPVPPHDPTRHPVQKKPRAVAPQQVDPSVIANVIRDLSNLFGWKHLNTQARIAAAATVLTSVASLVIAIVK